MPTSLCWKGKAIVCGKVKSKSRHGARKHDRTGLHPSSSQRLSPTAQHAPPLQPLGPASGFQPLPTQLLSGVGPLRLTPGQRTPSGAQPDTPPGTNPRIGGSALNRVCSIFSQILHLFSRLEFESDNLLEHGTEDSLLDFG